MKRIGTLVLILLLLLTGCSRPLVIDPVHYEDHPFDLSLLTYMGLSSDQVIRHLKQEKIDWEEYRSTDGILRGADLADTVTVAGDEYQCSLNWYPYPGEFYSISFHRSLDGLSPEEYRAEISDLYELMQGILANAGKSDISHTLKAWLSNETSEQESGYYSACWILEEDIRIPTTSEKMALNCALWVQISENTVMVSVGYELDPGPRPL